MPHLPLSTQVNHNCLKKTQHGVALVDTNGYRDVAVDEWLPECYDDEGRVDRPDEHDTNACSLHQWLREAGRMAMQCEDEDHDRLRDHERRKHGEYFTEGRREGDDMEETH